MKIEHKPLAWFKRDKNVRVDLGPEYDIRQLGESLKKRQIRPLRLRSSGDRRGRTIDSGYAGRRPA